MATRLRCEHGEWKTRDQFSKNQLRKYDAGARTSIRCIEHSAKQSLELQCQGPCERWRELQFFSKSTRRNGTNWCLDCTDWQNKTEVGEFLPAPGGQLSVEETQSVRLPDSAHLRDDMVLEDDIPGFDDVASSFASDMGSSNLGFTTTSVSESLQQVTESVNEESVLSYGKVDKSLPSHLRQGQGKSPHWLLPNLDGPSTTGSVTASLDNTSVTGSVSTARGVQGPAISFNAWGPDGEYARMIKTPTAVSDSTRTETTTSHHRTPNSGRKGWAKVPSRKQPPQLPDYLKYDKPYEDEGEFEGDSDNDM